MRVGVGYAIVQRLDGINWVHRIHWAGLRYTVRAIYGNANLSFIRGRLADHVIYQSQFIKRWWEDWYQARARTFLCDHEWGGSEPLYASWLA